MERTQFAIIHGKPEVCHATINVHSLKDAQKMQREELKGKSGPQMGSVCHAVWTFNYMSEPKVKLLNENLSCIFPFHA